MNCFPYNMFGQALPLKHAQIEPARPKRWPDTKPQGPKAPSFKVRCCCALRADADLSFCSN
jgi:hypothetical protein